LVTTPFTSIWRQLALPEVRSPQIVNAVVLAVPFTESSDSGFAVPIPTLPLARMVNRLVVALPAALVDDAMEKIGLPETAVRWIPRSAKEVVVPNVMRLPKRFAIVEEAEAMRPPVKEIVVDVETMLLLNVEVKGQAKSEEDETLLLKVVQSPAVKSPRVFVVADGMLKVKAPATFVIPQSFEIAVEEVAKVMAPDCAVPKVWAMEETIERQEPPIA
jgi:hypothetical protein